ncbi:MAG: hypothetical protein R6U04_05660 [Bacteroidales bacterium]
MNKYSFDPKGINDFEEKFNCFIELHPLVEIRRIDFSRPLINYTYRKTNKLVVSIIYI